MDLWDDKIFRQFSAIFYLCSLKKHFYLISKFLRDYLMAFAHQNNILIIKIGTKYEATIAYNQLKEKDYFKNSCRCFL